MPKINFQKYGMSKARYEELRAFVKQYPEFKQRRKDILEGRGQVENRALAAAELSDKIELIESCIKKACEGVEVIEPYLLKNVTEDVSPLQMLPPIHRDGFYKRRWLFYIELSKMKK